MKRGFTLIELLIVVGIMGVMAAFIVVAVCENRPSYNYQICGDSSFDCIYADDIEYRDNCAVNEKEEAICGSFTVKSLNKDTEEHDDFD